MDPDGKSEMKPTTTTTEEESPLLQNPNPRSSLKMKVPEVEIHLSHDGKSEMEPTTTTTEEESPLLQNPNTRSSVKTKDPEVEVHLYRVGKGPVEVLRSALGGWDQDRLEVQDLLDKHGLKSLHAFSPGSGRGAPIRFNARNGRSLLPYKDGSVIYVDGEPKDSLLQPITKIIVGIAMLTLLIAVLVREEVPVRFNISKLTGDKFPPWVIACIVIAFTRLRKRTKNVLQKFGR